MRSELEFLDTNLILRYLLNDVPEHALRAASVIENQRELKVSLVVLAEVAFGLTKLHGVPRERVVDELVALLDRTNVSPYEVPNALAIEALNLCRPSGRVSFADALLWATARASGGTVWTFDERFPSDQIEVKTP